MKIGLCLSGGGARGAYHIGVLKALDEGHIKVHIMSGCSAGALIASLYSAGVKPETMFSLAISTSWLNFVRPGLPDKGLIGMEYLKYILNKYIPVDHRDCLKIPIKIVATNLSQASIQVFESGPVIQSVLASCSIPLLFKPIMIDNDWYLDGGILMNLPASIIRKDCDFLIGVSLMPVAPVSSESINTSLKLINRVLELSVYNSSHQELAICDLVISSEKLATYSRFDLKQAEQLFELGYQACKSQLHKIPNSN
jgi:NTE family protein